MSCCKLKHVCLAVNPGVLGSDPVLGNFFYLGGAKKSPVGGPYGHSGDIRDFFNAFRVIFKY